MIKKWIKKLILVVGVFSLIGLSFAQEQYHYFYSETCGHCIQVAKYFSRSNVDKTYDIKKYEIFQQEGAMQTLQSFLDRMSIPLSSIGTPFLVIENGSGELSSLIWAPSIINYFDALKSEGNISLDPQTSSSIQDTDPQNPWKFLWIMIPMAIADSINPCAFAVMLLLLSTIFTKSKSRKKTILSGLLFSFAIFLSYFLIWLGVLRILGTSATSVVFKWIIGGLGILIGLGNIKDYFWYGEWGFLMEVPLSWRPKMMKLIQSVISPCGAFVIGILVSLFLLPCSSGPYMVILGLLKSTNIGLKGLGMWYLSLYNFLFVLPMLLITLLVGSGQATVEKLAKFKHKNTKLMHLVIWILMLLLGLYVIAGIYWNLGF